MADWGKGVNNGIGWGQGGTNDIGYGSIYAVSNSGLTLLLQDNRAFIMEVDTSKTGSNSDQFQFTGAQGDYDVVAKQNGIVVQTFNNLSNQETITFSNGSGVYVLEVNAKEVNGFTGMRFIDSGDKLKLLKIIQWGIFNETRSSTFFGCENLTEIGNDNDWLNSITSGFRIFAKSGLTSLPASLNLNSLTNGSDMFLLTSLTSLPLGMALTSLENGNAMFKASPLTSLPALMILDNLENGNQMFFGCQLTSLSSEMNLANLENGTLIFHSNTIDTAIYSTLLVNMQNLNSNTNVSFNGGNSQYNDAGEVARNLLINNQSWSFNDGGKA